MSADVKMNYRLPGYLPQFYEAKTGYIPINKHNQRLDYYLRRPSTSDYQAFADSYPDGTRPCTWLCLTGQCRSGLGCPYDHAEIGPEVVRVVRYTTRKRVCCRGSLCRLLNCIYGHTCQNGECVDEDTSRCCMRSFHKVTLVFTLGREDSAGSQAEYAEDMPVESFWF
jgi:hypothetical protein